MICHISVLHKVFCQFICFDRIELKFLKIYYYKFNRNPINKHLTRYCYCFRHLMRILSSICLCILILSLQHSITTATAALKATTQTKPIAIAIATNMTITTACITLLKINIREIYCQKHVKGGNGWRDIANTLIILMMTLSMMLMMTQTVMLLIEFELFFFSNQTKIVV